MSSILFEIALFDDEISDIFCLPPLKSDSTSPAELHLVDWKPLF